MRAMRTKAKAMKPSHKQENETKHLLEEIKSHPIKFEIWGSRQAKEEKNDTKSLKNEKAQVNTWIWKLHVMSWGLQGGRMVTSEFKFGIFEK